MNLNSLHISRTVGVAIVLGLIVLAAIGYTLMPKAESDDTITVDGGASTESEANFISLATELDSIDFNTAILSDPRFLGLSNIHTAITPEAQGRNDPFSL
jgi:hypothetical protein